MFIELRKDAVKTISMVLLILLVIASAIGCNPSTSTTSPEKSTVPSSQTSGEESTITEEVADELDPVTLTMFFNHPWVPADTFTGIIPEEITKLTGVTLDSTKAIDDTQLGVMIASNDLPDLVYSYDERNRLSTEALSYAWEDLIPQYAPDFEIPNELKDIARTYSEDGKFYTIINWYSGDKEWADAAVGCPGQSALYYRSDILEALGNPPLKTVDDYLNVLEMVKVQYPDMIPLGLDPPYWYFQSLAVWIGADTNTFSVLDDGNVVYKTGHPKYLDYLKFVNNLYRNGYISAENYAIQSEADSLAQIAYSGKAFSFMWYTGDKPITMNAETQKNIPDAEWKCMLPLSDEYKFVRTPTGWSGTWITQNCERPDRAIQFMQFMWSPEGQRLSMWGREGTDYTLDDRGVPVFSDEWMASKVDASAHAKTYNPWFYMGVTEVIGGYSDYSGLPQEIIDANNAIKELTVNDSALGLAVPNSSSDMGTIRTKLDDLVKTEEAKCFFSNSEEELITNYENFMAACEQIGVSQLNEWITNNYSEIKENFS